LRHHRVGDLEIRGGVLQVVVILQRIEQLHLPLCAVEVALGGGGFPHQPGGLGLAQPRLQRGAKLFGIMWVCLTTRLRLRGFSPRSSLNIGLTQINILPLANDHSMLCGDSIGKFRRKQE
jgi:hypothetical protein